MSTPGSHGIVGAFASHNFLGGLSERHLMLLGAGARPFKTKAGDYLGKDREPAHAFYLVQSGHVALEVRRKTGETVPVEQVGPGDIVGWSWLVPPHRWSFDCRAVDDVQGIAFDAEWLREKCEQDPSLGYHLLKQMVLVMAGRMEATRRRLVDGD